MIDLRFVDADKVENIIDNAGDLQEAKSCIAMLQTEELSLVIHAKWIYHKQNIFSGYKEYRECSNCNIWFEWEMPRNSYCPNCGAKMDKE